MSECTTTAGLSLADRAALIAAYPVHPDLATVPASPASRYVPPRKPKRRSGTSKPACVTWLLSVTYTCMWCGLGDWARVGRSAKTWEHVRPRSEGGTNGSKNAGVAHGGCNSDRPAYDEVRDSEVHLRWLAMTLAGFDDVELGSHAFTWFVGDPHRVAARVRRVAMRAELAARVGSVGGSV